MSNPTWGRDLDGEILQITSMWDAYGQIEIDGWADLGCLNGCKNSVIHPHVVKSLMRSSPLTQVRAVGGCSPVCSELKSNTVKMEIYQFITVDSLIFDLEQVFSLCKRQRRNYLFIPERYGCVFLYQSDQNDCSFYLGTLNFRPLLAFLMPGDVCFILCPLVTERFKLGTVSACKSSVALAFQIPN